MTPVYKFLAQKIQARLNCLEKSGRMDEWRRRHEDDIIAAVDRYMPRGSGIDNGTQIDLDRSSADKLVFTTAYHHMNGNGYYDGWTNHTVTVRPSLTNAFALSISGRDRNKEYLYQTFDIALREDTDTK